MTNVGLRNPESVPVVILCGGRGMRLNEQTESIPKPLVQIGGMPILWHIMKLYAHFGFKDFILCLGYKGEKIREFFMEHRSWRRGDFTLHSGPGGREIDYHFGELEDWTITFADTGLATNTGGRLKAIQRYITGPTFFATYGDGLSDLDLRMLLAEHQRGGRLATMTCVTPRTHFGIVDVDEEGRIRSYQEKPLLNTFVNGGFFVCNREIFPYLGENEMFEQGPFDRLLRDGQFYGHRHQGFWMCMDTYKDNQVLNDLWERGDAPWKIWNS